MPKAKFTPLTAAKIKSLGPGAHHDGHGLYLLVDRKSGGKSWAFRYTQHGKAHWMGLGSLATFNLAEARERARKQRQLLADDIDPMQARNDIRDERQRERNSRVTFETVAREFLETKSGVWKSEKDALAWVSRFETYVFPIIGKMPIGDVDTASVLRVIEPIWSEKNQTAIRLRSKIENVIDLATGRGLRSGDNPAAGKLINKVLPARTNGEVEHFDALPVNMVPKFMAALRASRGRTRQSRLVAKAVEWLVLTACRSNEVRGAAHHEIETGGMGAARAIWSIPAARMKGGKPHTVPLSQACLDLLRGDEMPDGWSGGRTHLFPISDDAMRKLARRVAKTIGYTGNITIHGFRSTFSDWCVETNVSWELKERALAHEVGGKVERSYTRTQLVEQRRPVMAAWAAYAGSAGGSGVR